MKKTIVTGFFAALAFAGRAESPRPADNQWEGAKVAVFGDSITDPAQTNSQRVYWQYLADWLKWNPGVFGISGHSWSDMPGQIDCAEKAMGDDVDAVTIFLGANDYAAAVPLGRWYDIVDGSTKKIGQDKAMEMLKGAEQGFKDNYALLKKLSEM